MNEQTLFRISANGETIKALRFVMALRAEHSSSQRYALEYIAIKQTTKKTRFISTDGRSLHIATIFTATFKEIPDGLYDFTPHEKDIGVFYLEKKEGIFPKYTDVLPDRWKYKTEVETKSVINIMPYLLLSRDGRIIECNKFESTIKYSDSWTIYLNEPNLPIGLEAKLCKSKLFALIAPIIPTDFPKITFEENKE